MKPKKPRVGFLKSSHCVIEVPKTARCTGSQDTALSGFQTLREVAPPYSDCPTVVAPPQTQVSSLMLLSLLKLCNAGIFPAILAVIIPAFLGANTIFGSATASGADSNKFEKLTSSLKSGVKTPDSTVKSSDYLSEPTNSIPPLSAFGIKLAEAGEGEGAPLSAPSPGSLEQPGSLFKQQQLQQIEPQPTPFENQPDLPGTVEEQQPQKSPTQNPRTQSPTPAGNTPTGTVNKNIKVQIAPVGDPKVQADGRSTIQFRGQITNADGEIIRRDVLVTLTSSAGEFIGADKSTELPGFQVRAINGEFIATLQSGLKPQPVRVRAAVDRIKQPSTLVSPSATDNKPFPAETQPTLLNDAIVDVPVAAYTQVEFTTYLRPSLATGVINVRIGPRGTDYWGRRSEFLRLDEDEGTAVDVYGAAFATGTVGEWLVTGAFNSDRPINLDCEDQNRLFGGVQFCEQQYPVYGDSSTTTATTPSTDSFYARIERSSSIIGADPDYAMWGDYNSTEFARPSQLFTATNRQLHGFKGNYNFGQLQITGMYANNIEGFQRDTIVPDGTSGNYFLSRRLLVPGSEIVFLEEEQINRPGTVLKRTQLTRGRDYQIDYDRGTVQFFSPVGTFNIDPFEGTRVRKLVVTYQPEGGDESDLFGGRIQYNISQDLETKSFVAGSYLREDRGDQDFELFGADFLFSFGDNGQILGEYARSNNSLAGGDDVEGNAYRLEASGKLGTRFTANAFYREVEPNFTNNATFSFSPGQTRYGGSLLFGLSKTTFLGAGYDVEENYGRSSTGLINFFDLFDPQPQARPGEAISNELKTFRAGILQKFGDADASLEYVNRSREDRVRNDFNGDAEQLVSRLKVPITQSLTFQGQNEFTLDGDSDPLYPNRTILALDWEALPGVSFQLAHQFYDDTNLLPGNSLTTLSTNVNHQFSEDTTLAARYSVLSGFNGLQGQGAVGVNQGVTVSPGLRLNLGYQYVFKNIFNATAAGDRYPQYYSVGQTSSSLGLFSGSVYSVGLEYTDNPDFKASGRVELRDGDVSNNTYISLAAAGKLSPALTALARYQQAGEANVFLPTSGGIDTPGFTLQELGDTANFKLGLAYRDPSSDKFNGLLKYEWRQNFDSIPDTQFTGSTSTGHVFSAEGIYAPNWRWEFYGKYALRNGVTYFDGDRYDGTVNLTQARATYRLGYRNDLAVEGRWIGQGSNSNPNFDEFGFAVETGYYVTPDLRVGLGYAFGSVDDRDFTGYRSTGGVYLNISLKLNELIGGFGLQKPVPPQQQESEVERASTTQESGTSSQIRRKELLVNRLRDKSGLSAPTQTAPNPNLDITQTQKNDSTSKTPLINRIKQKESTSGIRSQSGSSLRSE